MAGKDRTKIPALIAGLSRSPERFDFFQAVRLLEMQVGEDFDARVRLRPDRSMGFPKSDLAAFSVQGAGEVYELTTNFLGLYGVSSPLPAQVSQRVLHADEQEPPLRAFLDVFNHQLLHLYYLAWKKYRHEIGFGSDGEDPIGKRLLALMGVHGTPLRRALPVEPDRLLPRLGLLTLCSRAPASLTQLICGLMPEVPPVRVTEFAVRSVRIRDDERCKLGQRHCRLGEDLVTGSHVKDIAGAIRLVLGPMSYDDYLAFGAGGAKRQQLLALVRYLLVDPLDIQITVVLAEGEAAVGQLGVPRHSALGRSLWVGHPSRKLQSVTDC